MTVKEAISARRSVRKYQPTPIPDDILKDILESAVAAPSAHNYQPWKIIVVTDPGVIEAISADQSCIVSTGESTQVFDNPSVSKGAPVVLVGCTYEKESILRFERGSDTVICGKWAGYEHEYADSTVPYTSSVGWDIAIAFDHITLAAREYGIGTCWIATFRIDSVRAALDIPDGVRIELLMSIGYPEEWPDPNKRKQFDDLISFNRY